MDLRRLDQFAREHHGLVTRRAFQLTGLSERQWYRAMELGLLELVYPKVARMIGSERTISQSVCAAVLASGRDAMASHRSAAYLWGIPRPNDEPIDVLLPRRTRRSDVGEFVVHRPRDLKDLTPVLRTNIRTTNILRTLCDLGALDAPAVPAAVGHVVTTGLASPAALRKAVTAGSTRGRALAAEPLVDDRTGSAGRSSAVGRRRRRHIELASQPPVARRNRSSTAPSSWSATAGRLMGSTERSSRRIALETPNSRRSGSSCSASPTGR